MFFLIFFVRNLPISFSIFNNPSNKLYGDKLVFISITKFKKKSAEKPQDSVLYIDYIFITSDINLIFFVTNLQLEILSPLFVPIDKKIVLLI